MTRFESESDLERYVRKIIKDHLTSLEKRVYALDNKKAVDIVICDDRPNQPIRFLELKLQKPGSGYAKTERTGIGSRNGQGFQPEILKLKPSYFESDLRWVLASNVYQVGGFHLMTTDEILENLSGNQLGDKHNNIKADMFKTRETLTEQQFISKLRTWMNIQGAD